MKAKLNKWFPPYFWRYLRIYLIVWLASVLVHWVLWPGSVAHLVLTYAGLFPILSIVFSLLMGKHLLSPVVAWMVPILFGVLTTASYLVTMTLWQYVNGHPSAGPSLWETTFYSLVYTAFLVLGWIWGGYCRYKLRHTKGA